LPDPELEPADPEPHEPDDDPDTSNQLVVWVLSVGGVVLAIVAATVIIWNKRKQDKQK
jgi:hypothetical protein